MSPSPLRRFLPCFLAVLILSMRAEARVLVAEVMVKGAEFAIVRPRQTWAELLGQDRLPRWL